MKSFYVSKIEVNKWNMNRMAKQEYDALLEDMRNGGPRAINPIEIMPKKLLNPQALDDVFVVVDGAHRLKAAKELRWERIPAVLAFVANEQEARVVTFSKNNERGSHDPYLEAESFQWFVDQGKTQEDIATLHRVDRTTIAKRISLLKLDPKVRKVLTKVPCVTVSHLEPISTLEVEDQQEVVKEITSYFNNEVTVEEVDDQVRQLKRKRKENEELAEVVAKSKFPKCPSCGGEPVRHYYEDLPIVTCKNLRGGKVGSHDNHTWSLTTGKTKTQMNAEARVEEQEEQPAKKPEPPKFIRSTHTRDEFLDLFSRIAKELFKDFETFTELSLKGQTKDGKKAEVEIRSMFTDCSLHVERGMNKNDYYGPEKNRIQFTVEPKEYKAPALVDIKTLIRPGVWDPDAKDLRKIEKQISKLFKDYPPRKQGRPRKEDK